MNSKEFSTALLLVVLGCTFLFSGFILWANPFGLFEWPIRAINYKPMNTHGEVYKARFIERYQPEFIVFGNSRAEMGFSVNAEFTGFDNGVNAAAAGSSFPEIERMARHALIFSNPKAFLIVIDPNSFTSKRVRHSFEQLAIGQEVNVIERLWRKFIFHFHWSYAWDELLPRIRPSPSPANAPPFSQSGKGGRTDEDMRLQVQKEGGSQRASVHWEMVFGQTPNAFLITTHNNLNLYFELLVSSCRRGIRVVTLIPPMHIRMRQAWIRGLGENFLDTWLKSLGDVNHRAETICPINRPELWVTQTDNEVNTEPLPDQGISPGREMTHHWETSHFRRHLGDDVTSQIFLGTKPKWILAQRTVWVKRGSAND